MPRSRTTPEPPTSPDAEANDLPDWLRSRDVSSVGRHKPSVGPKQAASPHALLTIPEVAERLRVSTRTVFRWIATGELICIRIGRVVRVPAEALGALVRAGKIS
jgi:excisionase family DNA binding protein